MMALHVDMPQLELFSWVAKDLQTWIEQSKRKFHYAEEEAAKMTPGLFREYSQANDEGRIQLLVRVSYLRTVSQMFKCVFFEPAYSETDQIKQSHVCQA